MSLLLDALKKAADEKKKDSSAAENSEGEEKAVDSSKEEDMDLDLELSQQEKEEFPEVNEEIIRRVESKPEIEKKSQPAINEPDESQEIELSLEPETENQASSASSDDESKLQNTDSVIAETSTDNANSDRQGNKVSTENGSSNSDEAEASKEIKPEASRQQVEAMERKRHQDMEALSALINKNNEYSNRNRRIISVSIISLILLILIGASLYAYIMLDSIESEKLNRTLTKEVSPVVKPQDSKQVEAELTKPVATTPEQVQTKVSKQSASVKKKVVKPVVKKPIQIKKSTAEDPIGVLLAKAYAAFKQSEFISSKNLYNKVINRDKNNRDALLGLAAIAVKQNEFEQAKKIYGQLLTLDPKDSYAKAGMSTLINQKHAQLNESQLKLMLREQPNAGHVHFALGNLLLNQKRYAEAQTAYFNAWSTNKTNTDYAFNLAVSLDHLGKPVHASEFYELTVKLYQVSGGNVSIEDVKQRINQIKGKQDG